MINKIDTMRTVAKNLTSHLCTEGKTKITKPAALIPGAVAATGVVITLETKDNNANIAIQKDNTEIQRAIFNYNETPGGYELLSATSSYYYDDKNNKEIQQNHFLIEPEYEKTFERSINYKNAPLRKTTSKYIDKINSSVAQAAGYQSVKIDYDPQESHTYGKKSLQRDIPALLKILDIIAPNAEFTLKMKDKLKKDNKTSLIAFEASDTQNKNDIVKGFMSTNGDSVSYHIDTEDMTIIGEQSPNKDFSRAFLKPQKASEEVKKDNNKDKKNKTTTTTRAVTKKSATKANATDASKQNNNIDTTKAVPTNEPKPKTYHVLTTEYYSNLIVNTAANKDIPTRKKVEIYKDTLASAYLDGYTKDELETILTGNGLLKFSPYCKKRYINDAINLATINDYTKQPIKTLDTKIKELQNININIDDEALNYCIKCMINIISNMQGDTKQKETFIDKALCILNNSASENYESDLLLFIQDASKINDDLKLHYEIYEESVYNKKVENLKSQIELMINNVSDTKHHKQRNEFLTQLYLTNNLKELEQLQHAVQNILNEQISQQTAETSPAEAKIKKLSITDLSKTNQKIVKKLLGCKSPKTMILSFEEVKNLLEDIGFSEGNVSGSHHKFIAPLEINYNGQRQCFLSICTRGTKSDNPALIDDLIRVCRQYYGSK